MKQYGDIIYMNDGDWVESCSALVEHFDGTWEIIFWADIVAQRGATSKAAAVLESAEDKPLAEAAE